MSALSAACTCEEQAHGHFGIVSNDERLVRLLTDRHFSNAGKLKTSAFDLSDIMDGGVSLVRASLIGVLEFQAVAEDIRKSAKASEVRGALISIAQDLRALRRPDGERLLCVKDDPVIDKPPLRDNPAHAITMSTKPIDRLFAQEIRDQLLSMSNHARYLNEVWQDTPDNT